jgi:hypothetical protein
MADQEIADLIQAEITAATPYNDALRAHHDHLQKFPRGR